MRRFGIFLLPAVLGLMNADCVRAQANSAGEQPQRAQGQMSEEDLGNALQAIGLKPTKNEKRYDFAFKTSIKGDEWNFSMSTVLSRNEESVWVMAWLDRIPKTSAEVPRTALLRLLAANDRLGNGKFFAYIPSNRRFVLQRTVANEQMTARKLRSALQDLAISVATEYPVWSTANWVPKKPDQRVAGESDARRPSSEKPAVLNRPNRIHASESASKYTDKRIN